MSSWLRNSMRMSEVGVPVGSTKCPLTQLKVTTLVSRPPLTNAVEQNSRSGASPLSLHHPPQKVNPPAKTKIKKEKRKVKNLITRARTQVSPPPGQKPCHECSFPPRSKKLRAVEQNSRSGASPLSLHHPPQKVNPPTKTKIKKEKRKVKNLITRTRTQVSPPPSQKPCHECSFPPRSKELRVNAARVPSHPSLIIELLSTKVCGVG